MKKASLPWAKAGRLYAWNIEIGGFVCSRIINNRGFSKLCVNM